jgi:hypothetical protein
MNPLNRSLALVLTLAGCGAEATIGPAQTTVVDGAVVAEVSYNQSLVAHDSQPSAISNATARVFTNRRDNLT